MSVTYEEVLKSAEEELRRRMEGCNPWSLWRATEMVAAEAVELIRIDTALEFLSAHPDAMGWVTPTSDEPLWIAVRDAVSARICDELHRVGVGLLAERLGNLRDVICRLIDFASYVAEAVPEIAPGCSNLDMTWTADVGSARYDDVKSVVYGALEVIAVLQPLANIGFDLSTLQPPWNEEGPVVLREMEALRVIIANEPTFVYGAMMSSPVTRMHSHGKVYSR